MSCVRFSLLSPADIVEFVEPNTSLFTGTVGRDMLVSIYRTHMMILSGLTPTPPEPPRNYQSPPTFPGSGSLYFRPLEYADTRCSQFHFNIQSQLNSQQLLFNSQQQSNSRQPLSRKPEEDKALTQPRSEVVEPASSWGKSPCLPCEAKLMSADEDTQKTGSGGKGKGGEDDGGVGGVGGGGSSRNGGSGREDEGGDSNSLGSRSVCGGGGGGSGGGGRGGGSGGGGGGSGGRGASTAAASTSAAAAVSCNAEPERKTITIRTPERCEGAQLDLLLTPKVSERSLTLGSETDDNSKGREGGDSNEMTSSSKDCAKDCAKDYATDCAKDHAKNREKDCFKDYAKDCAKTRTKDCIKDRARDYAKDYSKDYTKDCAKDCFTDRARDSRRFTKATSEVPGRRGRSSLERSTTSRGSCGCENPGDDVIDRSGFPGRSGPSSLVTRGRLKTPCHVTGFSHVSAREGGVTSRLRSVRSGRPTRCTAGEQGAGPGVMSRVSSGRRFGYGTRIGGGGGGWERGGRGGRGCGVCDSVTSRNGATTAPPPSLVLLVQAPRGPAEVTSSSVEAPGLQEARKTSRVSFDLTPSYDLQDSGLPRTDTPPTTHDTLDTLSRAAVLLGGEGRAGPKEGGTS
ncbi:glycine, alanine and asparagine-rich protein [Aplysia californica]|uniref:Glycine, alanine and asparagine-rich protein n=1 Tax=Aplysia californica TaxID=6500 RepID=A0ABM1A5H4_APLCA|nr:glycine, alanine and asparagine-rich protein [Aplysia californica]